jgi:hypothetical protein
MTRIPGRGGERHPVFGAEDEQRATISQTVARLIAEHGITDWAAAKRKAARELGLPDRTPLPNDDDIKDALSDYHALFGGDEHVAMLRSRREEALRWMRRLSMFEPRLTGGVAEGWASEHSDVRIELTAEDAKAVELALINQDVRYRALAEPRPDAPAELFIDTPRAGVRLIVRTPGAARQRPRRDRHGQPAVRLDVEALEELLEKRGEG